MDFYARKPYTGTDRFLGATLDSGTGYARLTFVPKEISRPYVNVGVFKLGQRGLPWYKDKRRLKTLMGLLAVPSYFLVGTLYYTQVEGWSVDEAMYFCVVVATTVGYGVRPLCAPIFPIFLPRFRLYEVVSLHRCVLPYKCRKILEMLLELMKLCDITGRRTNFCKA